MNPLILFEIINECEHILMLHSSMLIISIIRFPNAVKEKQSLPCQLPQASPRAQHYFGGKLHQQDSSGFQFQLHIFRAR